MLIHTLEHSDIHDEEVEDDMYLQDALCHFNHTSTEVVVVVTVCHEAQQQDKWSAFSIGNFQDYDVLDREIDYTLGHFADELYSRAVRWVPCAL